MSNDMMEALVNRTIKINRGGPESKTGKLLAVKDDYLVLFSEEDGVVYFKNQHIKSISENVKDGVSFDTSMLNTLNYKLSDDFSQLIADLKYQWVKINRGGPEKVEGVLHDINGDFVTVIKNEEVVRMALYHIRSISYGVKPEKTEDESSS